MQDSVQRDHIEGLVQDCSNSIANALELQQSCTKPSIYPVDFFSSFCYYEEMK